MSETQSSKKPTYVYKLISSTTPPPNPLPESLPLSSIDIQDGFIHLSTAIQIPNTLKHFYNDEPRVYVLRIPYDPIEKDIRWEDPKASVCGDRGGEGMFPHLYNGGRLGIEQVESVAVWEKHDSGWDERLKEVGSWLVY